MRSSGKTQPALNMATVWWCLLLIEFVLIIASAFALIYVKHLERTAYHQLQIQQQRAHALHLERNQLLLEQSTWKTPARLQAMATTYFGLKMPGHHELIMVVL